MNVCLFVPFGSSSPEAGMVYLIGKYLLSLGHQIQVLRCDGAFSLCDRDAEDTWRRSVTSCFSCMREQKGFAQWGEFGLTDLATFLNPQDIESSWRWVVERNTTRLIEEPFEGHKLYQTIQQSFINRFSVAQPDINNKQHDAYLRRLILAAARMHIAARRFVTATLPNLAAVAGARDYLSTALLSELKLAKRDGIIFQMHVAERSIQVIHPGKQQALSCDLLVENVTRMRSDVRTWSRELIVMLDTVLEFLEIEPVPVAFSLARA